MKIKQLSNCILLVCLMMYSIQLLLNTMPIESANRLTKVVIKYTSPTTFQVLKDAEKHTINQLKYNDEAIKMAIAYDALVRTHIPYSDHMTLLGTP